MERDGIASTGRLTLGNIALETPAVFPSLRTTQNPNDLELLMNDKNDFQLDRIQGGVIRLYNVPPLLQNRMKNLTNGPVALTLENKPLPRDSFASFYNSNLLVCDPAMEYTRLTKPKYDERFVKRLPFIERLSRYFREFEEQRKEIEVSKSISVERLRRNMNERLWLGSSKGERKERNAMAEQIMLYQLKYFHTGTPVTPLVETLEELKVAIELNEVCQAISYANNKDCVSYIPFHRFAVKNRELISRYIQYLRDNKTSKLDAMKFRDLDLHCPVDYKARRGFKHFLEEMAGLRADQPDRGSMLLDGGTQYYVAMQVFDIVSTSMTGFDGDVDGGGRKKGEEMTMSWWNEMKMWPIPADEEAPKPNPGHCEFCQGTPDFDVEPALLNRRRRGHKLSDLNNDASDMAQAIESKKVGVVMRKRIAFAEFSYANDLILSP